MNLVPLAWELERGKTVWIGYIYIYIYMTFCSCCGAGRRAVQMKLRASGMRESSINAVASPSGTGGCAFCDTGRQHNVRG